MGKQKVVMQVTIADAKKRSKALKTAVGLSGVTSAALEGDDKDRIVVVGDGIDSVTLTIMLRKQMGFAELISVAPIEEKKENKNDNNQQDENKSMQPLVWPYAPYPYSYAIQDPNYNPYCCIL